MAIVKMIFMWVLEYFVKFFTQKALAEKAKQDRLKDSEKAAENLEKAKKENADEATIIELEEDMLNGSPRR